MPPEDPSNGCYESCGAVVRAVTKEVSALDRCERAATADIAIWDFALIQPDRDEPRVVRGAQSQLLDCEHEFLVLVASATGEARLGKAGDEHKRVISDRASDFDAPVFARPQVGRVPPDRNPGGLQYPLQLVDLT